MNDYTVTLIGDWFEDSPEQAVIRMAEWLADPNDTLSFRVSWSDMLGNRQELEMNLAEAFGEGDLTT